MLMQMLSDDRPDARHLLKEPFVQTMQSLIAEQTPSAPDTTALLAGLQFKNKSKALIAYLSLLRKQ